MKMKKWMTMAENRGWKYMKVDEKNG